MMAMPERLMIMRHGEAGPGRVDRDRELTRRGQAEARLMGAWLVESGLGMYTSSSAGLRLMASPYRRAQQTAALVADALAEAKIDAEVETLGFITPDDSPEGVVDWLLEQPAERPLLLISHMPLVGRLTGLLGEGRGDCGPGFVTAAVAELETEVWASGAARLARMITPADLNRPILG
jgi:phosphohistidine phosphatase